MRNHRFQTNQLRNAPTHSPVMTCQRGAALLVALLVSTAGCGGGGGSHHAVTRLSGLVATIDTATPVVGALVAVDGSAQQTLTTLRGAYFLDGVDVGSGWHTARAQKQIGGQPWTGERAVLFDPNIPVQSNLLITIGPAASQGTIRGTVTSAGGGALRNVTVFLNPGTTVAAGFRVTDSGGRYEFDNVPAGTYSVVASARDLVNSVTNQVSVTPGATVSVNFSLLVSSGTSVAAPTNLSALAFTYPDTAAASVAQIRAVQSWLRGESTRRVAQTSRRLHIQDWPVGSIIEAELAWTSPSANDLAGYVLDRAVGNAAFGTIDRFADPTATAYDDLDPLYSPDQTYQFRISAASTSLIQSAASNLASMQPFAPLGGLSPANGALVTGAPAFSWQPVARALLYQVLVLSRPPDV